MSGRKLVVWVILLILLILLALFIAWLAGWFRGGPRTGATQTPNVIVFAPLPGGTPSTPPRRWTLPATAYHTFTPSGTKPPAPARPPQQKLSPIISRWIENEGRGDERARFVVLWDDPIPIERFPELDPLLPLTAVFNMNAHAKALERIDLIRSLRKPIYKADTLGLTANKIIGIESYWLVQAMLMEMTVNQAKELAGRPRVVYVMPDSGGELPAGCNPSDNATGPYVKDGRAEIGSDEYFDANYPAVWMSLLDTGVSTEHELLGEHAHLSRRGDCVDGNADCEGGDPADVDPGGHGTSSAAILSGNHPSWGNDFRGVTKLDLHAYRVYKEAPNDGSARLLISSSIRGLERGAYQLSRVIVAEIQAESGDASPLAKAADHAFATGAVVIAAAGNSGPGYPVASPANARCALGVGAYVLSSGNTESSQSRGATGDGRQKPDLQAPTRTWTAGLSTSASDPSATACREFGETSGATPYAGGAAALEWGWLKNAVGAGNAVDPGQVMAMMIASTDMAPGALGTTEGGAGKLVLPTDGWGWYVKVTIDDTGDAVDIPIDLTGLDPNFLDVAAWWPEKVIRRDGNLVDTHNDIDVHLTAPDDRTLQAAQSDGVFERKTIALSAGDRGPWTVTIQGYEIRRKHQDVYVFVTARRASGGSGPITPPS